MFKSDIINLTGNVFSRNSRGSKINLGSNLTITSNDISNELMVYDVEGMKAIQNKIAGDVRFYRCPEMELIQNKFIPYKSYYRLTIDECEGFRFIENSMESLRYWSLRVYDSKGGMISGNKVKDGDEGYYIKDSSDIILERDRNTFHQQGHYIAKSGNITIRDCSISASYFGLGFHSSSYIHVFNNNLLECDNGIILSGSSNAGIISNNIIRDCEEYAIKVLDSTQRVTIVSNAFLRNNGATGYEYEHDSAQIYDETGNER